MMRVFATGAPRTGTTLLDKLLSTHPDVLIHSQPLPLLYVRLKRMFLQGLGHQAAAGGYPLNDMFLGNYYAPDQFAAFLRSRTIALS